MAGDWIKMRTDLYRDPKVCVIAESLMGNDGELARYVSQNCQRDMTVTRNVTRCATVGALVTVWGIMRHRGKRHELDLICRGVGLSVLDDVADLPGIGTALAKAGWVVAKDNGLVFPNFFEEYNVDPEEKRASAAAERQRRYREKQRANSDVTRDVTRDVTVTHREEKRREEKSIKNKRAFLPPTVEEVRAFCESRTNQIDPEEFVAHYSANGWVQSSGRPVKDWQACVVTWEKRRAKDRGIAVRQPPAPPPPNQPIIEKFKPVDLGNMAAP